MITLAEYWLGRDKLYPDELTNEVKANAFITVTRVNLMIDAAKLDRRVVSGWRPQGVNDKTSNAAKKSNHIIGAACDLEDKDRALSKWVLSNLDVLQDIGLWAENPSATFSWLHVQIYPPRSGRRVFMP